MARNLGDLFETGGVLVPRSHGATVSEFLLNPRSDARLVNEVMDELGIRAGGLDPVDAALDDLICESLRKFACSLVVRGDEHTVKSGVAPGELADARAVEESDVEITKAATVLRPFVVDELHHLVA
jgi:hypothetical protein